MLFIHCPNKKIMNVQIRDFGANAHKVITLKSVLEGDSIKDWVEQGVIHLMNE